MTTVFNGGARWVLWLADDDLVVINCCGSLTALGPPLVLDVPPGTVRPPSGGIGRLLSPMVLEH